MIYYDRPSIQIVMIVYNNDHRWKKKFNRIELLWSQLDSYHILYQLIHEVNSMAVSTFYLLKGMHSFIQNAMMKLDHAILPTKLPERMVKGTIWLECKFFKEIL